MRISTIGVLHLKDGFLWLTYRYTRSQVYKDKLKHINLYQTEVSSLVPAKRANILGETLWTLLQAIKGFNNTWTMNFQMFKLILEKAEKPETKLPTSVGSSKKQESFRKTSISALLTMPKPLTVWITTNCGKFWKGWEYQTTWPASWEICMQVRKQQLELDMEQQTGSK